MIRRKTNIGKKEYRKSEGFGLIEVLISSMILVTVVGAAVALGSASVRSAVSSADKTAAYNIAQDALEKVRSIRDTAWSDESRNDSGAEKNDWASDLWEAGSVLEMGGSSESLAYVLRQSMSGKWELAQYSSDPAVQHDGVEYIQIGEPPVKYYRKIYITNVGWYTTPNTKVPGLAGGDPNLVRKQNAVIRRVKVVVEWTGDGGQRSIEASTYLTDWKTVD